MKAIVLLPGLLLVIVGIAVLGGRAYDIETCERVLALDRNSYVYAYQTEAEEAACRRHGVVATLPVRVFLTGGRSYDRAPAPL